MSERNSEALDAGRIRSEMATGPAGLLRHISVYEEVDSTNSAVLRLPEDQRHAHVVIAECQSRGRGRGSRRWHSPPGGNVYLSLGWRFAQRSSSFSTLPLVAGVSVCEALRRVGLRGHGIKWPNDILIEAEKLAGILVQMQAAGSGPVLAVLGIGLNLRMPPGYVDASVDRPWTDLASKLPESPSRNRMIALLLEEMLPALERFQAEGFGEFERAWRELDLLRDRPVTVLRGEERLEGIARGIDESGGLRVEMTDAQAAGPTRVVHAAEVSVRYG